MEKLNSTINILQRLNLKLMEKQMKPQHEDFNLGILPYSTNIINFMLSCINTIDFKTPSNQDNAAKFVTYAYNHVDAIEDLIAEYLNTSYHFRVSPVWSRDKSLRSALIKSLQQFTDQFEFNYKQTFQNQINNLAEKKNVNDFSMQTPQNTFVSKPVFKEEYFKLNLFNCFDRQKHNFVKFLEDNNIGSWIIGIIVVIVVIFFGKFLLTHLSSEDGFPQIETEQVYEQIKSEKLNDEQLRQMVSSVQRTSLDKQNFKQNKIIFKDNLISFIGTGYSESSCLETLDKSNNIYPLATLFINEMKVIQKPAFSYRSNSNSYHPSTSWCKSSNSIQLSFNPQEIYRIAHTEVSVAEKIEYLKQSADFYKKVSYNSMSAFREYALDKSHTYYESVKNEPQWTAISKTMPNDFIDKIK